MVYKPDCGPQGTKVYPSILHNREHTTTAAPVSSHRKAAPEQLDSGSGAALVRKGCATRSHWVWMARRAPSHWPGPVRRYWYGVHGPRNTFNHSLGSVRNRRRRFGRTPICDRRVLSTTVGEKRSPGQHLYSQQHTDCFILVHE